MAKFLAVEVGYLGAAEQPGRLWRIQVVVGLAIAVLLVAGVAGVLTVHPDASRDAAVRVLEAPALARRAGTQRFEFTLKLKGAGRTVTVGESGVIDTARSVGTVHVDFGSALAGQTVDMVVVGSTVYIAVPANRRSVTNGKPWLSLDGSGLVGQSLGTGQDLLQNLDLLSAVGDRVQTIGHDHMAGVAATHYRAQLDAARVMDRIPPALQAQVAQIRASGVALGPLTVDVWLDGDGRPVRFDDSITVEGTTTSGSMILSDFGKPVTAAAPAPADTLEVGNLPTALRLLGIGPA